MHQRAKRTKTTAGTAAEDLHALFSQVLDAPFPLRLKAWDGSQAGPDTGPVLVVRHRRAVRRLLWAPDELGLGRAFVSGDLDVEGDLRTAMEAFLSATEGSDGERSLTWRQAPALARDAWRLGAIGLPPKPPAEEVRRRRGLRHSPERDAAAIRHHYDVGNDFYRLVLGPSMVYSCAYWASDRPGYGLDDAQRDKLDLVCRKLSLAPGMRLLDVGCGWGSMVLHAAREHGVRAVGITVSQEQAAFARARVAAEGLAGQVEIRVQDYRDVHDGPYDAVSSIGMAEHVGRAQLTAYAETLRSLLRPGGRLLHHAIAAQRDRAGGGSRPFIDRYVFPDGELVRLGDTVNVLEAVGFEVRDVQSLREHYALTLRAWVDRLEGGWDQAVALVGEGRARTWRLYMTGAAVGFDAGRTGVNQVLAVAPDAGRSGLPMAREDWLSPRTR